MKKLLALILCTVGAFAQCNFDSLVSITAVDRSKGMLRSKDNKTGIILLKKETGELNLRKGTLLDALLTDPSTYKGIDENSIVFYPGSYTSSVFKTPGFILVVFTNIRKAIAIVPNDCKKNQEVRYSLASEMYSDGKVVTELFGHTFNQFYMPGFLKLTKFLYVPINMDDDCTTVRDKLMSLLIVNDLFDCTK